MSKQLDKHGIPIKCENCTWWTEHKACGGWPCSRMDNEWAGESTEDHFEPSPESLESRIEELQAENGKLALELYREKKCQQLLAKENCARKDLEKLRLECYQLCEDDIRKHSVNVLGFKIACGNKIGKYGERFVFTVRGNGVCENFDSVEKLNAWLENPPICDSILESLLKEVESERDKLRAFVEKCASGNFNDCDIQAHARAMLESEADLEVEEKEK